MAGGFRSVAFFKTPAVLVSTSRSATLFRWNIRADPSSDSCTNPDAQLGIEPASGQHPDANADYEASTRRRGFTSRISEAQWILICVTVGVDATEKPDRI